MSQDDVNTSAQEDDLSLSISEVPLEFHSGDQLTMDLIHVDCSGELDMDNCLPRQVTANFCPLENIEMLATRSCVLTVWPRRRETICSSPVLHRLPRPFSLPSWQLSNRQCATMQRRPGGVTSTSLCVTRMDPALSTLSMCFLHYFRYEQSVVACLL